MTIHRGTTSPPRVALLPGPLAAGAYTEDDAHSVTLLVAGLDDAVIGNPTSAAGGEAAGAVLVLPGSALL